MVQDRDLFGVKSNDINYRSITNVIPNNRGIVNWIFDMGDIEIQTAATVTPLRFQHAPKPLQVVQKISENRQKFLQSLQKVTEKAEKPRAMYLSG